MKKFFKDFIIFICLFAMAGFVSLNLGMERWADTRNYHIYNPWAFLNNRIGIDIMPASVQSYYNPLPDLPYHFAIQYFNNHPKIITFLLGFSFALLLFLVYKIANMIFKDCNRIVLTILSVSVAFLSGFIMNQVGALGHDIFIADMILLSVYILLKMFDSKYNSKLLFFAGIFSGMALGFKYTTFILTVPLFITFLIFGRHFEHVRKSFLILTSAALLGFLLVDGFWMHKLYTTFQNPLFPYFNSVFHSPYINQDNVFSATLRHHMPDTTLKYYLYPFPKGKIEGNLIILLSIFLINLFTLPFIKKDKFNKIFNINNSKINFLICFFIISYALWLRIFGVERYLILFFGLVGILGIALCLKLAYIIGHKQQRTTFWATILCLIYFSTLCYSEYTSKRTKTVRIPAQNYILNIEKLNIPDNSVVLTGVGVGIIIPSQNPKAVYVKNTGVLPNQTIEKVKNKISKNPHNVFLINNINAQEYSTQEINKQAKKDKKFAKRLKTADKRNTLFSGIKNLKTLSLFGVDPDSAVCSPIKGNYYNRDKDILYFCKMKVLK